MNRNLARYFFMLIDKDLQFSFNGIGLPNNACEWLENQLMQENFDKVEEFIKLRYAEQNKKKIKKKRKLRAMTYKEYCKSLYLICEDCAFAPNWADKYYKHICPIRNKSSNDFDKPCKLPNGKYILIEVKK